MTPRTRRTLLVLAIVLVGLGIRCAGITGRGYPFTYYDDEAKNAENSVQFWDPDGGLDLNPHEFQKPALGYYLHFGEFGFYYLWGRYVTGEFRDPADFGRTFLVARGPFYAIARFFNCLAGALTIVATYRIGKRLHGREAGLFAAFLLAVTPGHVYWSALVKMDVLAALFATLAFAFILGIARTGSWRDHVWAGLLAGLGTATKYTPALLAVPITVAHLVAPRRGPRLSPRSLARLFAAAVALFAGFFLGSPYNFLDSTWYRHSVRPQLDLMGKMLFFGAGDVGEGDNVFTQALRLFHKLDDATAYGMGLIVLTVMGAVLGLARGGFSARGTVLVLTAVCAYVFILCTANEQYPQPNHVVILYPLLVCLAAVGPVWLARRLFADEGRRAAALALAAVLMLAPAAFLPGGGLAAIAEEVARPQPKTAAFAWIQENVPAGATIINDFEILPLLPDDDRSAWILERIDREIARAERNMATSEHPDHWRERLKRYRKYRLKYAFQREGVRELEQRLYDVIVLEKPWQTNERERVESATYGYNDLWPLFAATRPEDVPPVERYRLRQAELPASIPAAEREAHPVLDAPADFLVGHKQSYANYATAEKREQFPEWAAFYDDLLAHYDAWEFPDPAGGQGLGTVRVFDLRRRTDAPVVRRVEG